MEVCDVKKRLMKKMMKRQAECAVKKQSAACKAAADKAPVQIRTEVQADVKMLEKVQEIKAPKAKTKAAAAASEAGESKGAAKINIFYQFSQHQVEQQEIISRIKNEWKAQGNLMKDLKDLVIYLKAEENKAYYVINNDIKGNVAAWE